MWLQWEPSILLQELECSSCNTAIPVKSMFSINPDDIKNLVPNPNYPYQKAYSVKCTDCAIEDAVEQMLRQAADSGSGGSSIRESIKSVIRSDAGAREQPIGNIIRGIVREELKQILTEEAFDPHGPFSPTPES